MNLQNRRELEATRQKLELLQRRYSEMQMERPADRHVHELSMQSVKSMINQLTEEIARFEAHAGSPRL